MADQKITALTAITALTTDDLVPVVNDPAGTPVTNKITWANVLASIWAAITSITGKTTPIDADTFVISDSAASNVGKSVTWANVKATLKIYFDTLYSPLITLAQGTYTPTLYNTTNMAASTAYVCQYMRVGNVVTVSGRVGIDVTTGATYTEMGMTLPIASGFTEATQAGGCCIHGDVATNTFVIYADSTNDRLIFIGVPATSSNMACFFTVTYLIL